MADGPSTSSDSVEAWSEIINLQLGDNRRIMAQVTLRTTKIAAGSKEHHVKLCSDDEDCFLYRTTINLDEYRRLAQTNSFIASFDNLPQYLRQLLRAAKQEDEYGQSYLINIITTGTLDMAPRIELLITTRHAGQSVQNKVLNLPLTVASDTEFKEYLTLRFEKLKKEKEQLRRSASFLESQLRRERSRNRELEDKNHWFRKELKFTQNLLKSAENIQKHYEVILSLRHRGETGSTIVTIGDVAPKPLQGSSHSMDTDACDSPANSTITCESPIIQHKMSTTFSQTSDDGSEAKAIKRKVSFYDTTDLGSESDDDSTGRQSAKRPPPRKFAAAVPLFDDRLVQIRREEERRRSSTITSDDEDEDGEGPSWKKARYGDVGTSTLRDQKSPLLPSPLLPRAMSPPAVVGPPFSEGDTAQSIGNSLRHIGISMSNTPISTKPKVVECPNDYS